MTALASRFHRIVTRWLWGRAAVLAVVLVLGWATGSFEAGATVAVILMVVLVVGGGLSAGWMEWRAGRRFAAPKSRVLCSHHVMEQGWPILRVSHGDETVGGWQFVNGDEGAENEANLVAVHIQQVLERDPSVAAVAALPPGWRAWRSSEQDDWEVAPTAEPFVK